MNTHSQRSKLQFVISTVGVLCFSAGFAVAMAWGGQRRVSHASDELLPSAARDAPRAEEHTRRIERPFLTRPPELCRAVDHDAERRYQTQQVRELLQLLTHRLGAAAQFEDRIGPQGVANKLSVYMTGWLDALVRTAPDLTDELATQLQSASCDANTRPAQLILMARMIGTMPELGDARTFDCMLERGGEEGPVLTEALDAWRRGPLPKSEAMQRLESEVQDEHTRHQLVKLDDDVSATTPPEDFETAAVHAKPGLSAATPQAALVAALESARASGDTKGERQLTATLAEMQINAFKKDSKELGPPVDPEEPVETSLPDPVLKGNLK